MSDPHVDPTDELAGLIEDLHDSEINGEIGWFSGGVWRAKIGDPWNGYVAEKDGLLLLGQAVEWLPSKAIELYTHSVLSQPQSASSNHRPAVHSILKNVCWLGHRRNASL
jgi:hypothetical protein